MGIPNLEGLVLPNKLIVDPKVRHLIDVPTTDLDGDGGGLFCAVESASPEGEYLSCPREIVSKNLKELLALSKEDLKTKRYEKFRRFGEWDEI